MNSPAKLAASTARKEGHEIGTAIPAMKTVLKCTIEFESDVNQYSEESHTSGILHATKYSELKREEHCFVWLSHTSHYTNAYKYLKKFGFTKVVFVPYSCKKSWTDKYPAAVPHIHVDSKGNCVGSPYGPKKSTISAVSSANNEGIMYPQLKSTGNKRGKPKKKLFPDAKLSHFARDALHIEIYLYFAWLSDKLEKLEGEDNGKRMMGRAGISRRAVDNIVDELEALRVISYYKEDACDNLVTDDAPYLERDLVEQFEKIAEDTSRANSGDGEEVQSKRGRHHSGTLAFDEMFGRLMQYREKHGHVDIPHKSKEDVQLAQWVTNIRVKRRRWEKQQQDEAEQLANAADIQAVPKRRGRPQFLDQEKIDKLDSVGFTWNFNRENKTWEERYQDLIEYKAEYGHCNVPRKEGTFGEWVHIQRKFYKNKEKNFMKHRVKLLEDIGFDFHPRRKHKDIMPWDTAIHELEAFGTLNGHYDVPCPIPEHLEEEGYHGDDMDIANAYRLYMWVNQIRGEYLLYSSGKPSRLLNDERVNQLTDIGFEFD